MRNINILLVLLIVLTAVMAVDYLTGMFSASRTCEEVSNRHQPAIWREAVREKLENEVT